MSAREHGVRKLVSSASRALAVLSTTVTGLLVIIIVASVIGRMTTGRGIPAIIEFGELAMVMIVFLGFAEAERKEIHVRMSIVTSRLSERSAAVLRTVSLVLVLVTTAALVWLTTVDAIESVLTGEFRYGLRGFPIWPARIAIPIGLFVFAAVVLGRIAESIGVIRSDKQDSQSNHPGQSP